MSYISLYRKYRPTTFENIVGQDNITSILTNAVKNNKIAHAYLFNGSRGTGKTSTAKIFAKNICCEYKIEGNACNNCASCKSISNSSTMDIIEIDAASNNGVDEIKKIIENVHYAPTTLSHKIYIIDEVHMLSNSAFNALLKTIEEPPSHVVFILATTEAHKVPATIISRCQRFDFRKLSIDELKQTIKRVLVKEDIKFEDGAISKIAYLANGGARDALSITDKITNFANGEITEKQVCEVFGIADDRTKIDFLNLISSKNANSLLLEIENIIHSGIDLIRFTNSILVTLKDLLIFKQTKSDRFCESFSKENLMKIKLSKTVILNLIDVFLNSVEQMKANEDVRFYFQIACMEALRTIEGDIISHKDTESIELEITEEDLKEVVQETEHTNKIEEEVYDATNDEDDEEFEKLTEELEEKEIISELEAPELETKSFDDVVEDIVPIEEMCRQMRESPKFEKPQIELSEVEEEPRKFTVEDTQEVSFNPIFEPETKLKRITIENITNLILQKDDDQLKSAKIKMTDPTIDLLDDKYISYVSALKDGNIISASENALLMLFDYEAQSDLINHMRNDNKFAEVLKLIYGDYKDVYPVTKKELGAVKEKMMSFGGKKPKIQHISPLIPTEEDNPKLDFAKEIFGDLLEIQ